MGQIIQGAEISTYKTIAIALGQSKKENTNGVRSNYIVLSVKNRKSLLSGTRRIILFDEDIPGAFECLKAFASQTPDQRGGYAVDMAKFKADSTAMEEWEGLLEFPGGMVVEYPLSKGECYQNDIDGKRVMDKNGNPIKKKTVSVFVQVDMIKPGTNGTSETVYIDGFGKEEQGQRMEARFYREAVETQVENDDLPPLQTQTQGSEEQPPARPF